MEDNLTIPERKLADFMSDLSEDAYCAGWMTALEYVLWDAVLNGERTYGRHLINQGDIDMLINLSNDCGSCIYFDDVTAETATPLDEWRDKFKTGIAADPKLVKR